MALSLCSNWERMDHLSPDLSPFHQLQAELDSASLSLQEWLDLPQHQTDPFSDALDDFLYIDTDLKPPPTHFPSHSDPSVLSLPPDLYPDEFEFDLCPFPKRARSYNDIYFHSNPMLNDNYFDGSVIGDATTNYCVPEFLPEMELPVLPVGFSPTSTGCGVDPCLMYPVLASSYNACYESQGTNTGVLTFPAEGFSVGGGEKKNVGGGGCLSMQSVAARERRKRISEKTQELGRLIPGGNKMNTAEMFQGAYKYVKFLQAQVGVLGLLGSMGPDQVSLEGSPSVNGEQLQVLLGSLAIQEKLYHEEKCMVPKHLVESLAKDQEIKSKASISRDLAGFIESLG